MLLTHIYFLIDNDKVITAPSPNPLPNILYQLLTSPPPSPFLDILPMSNRDADDGFVHLARALNILPLAMKNYNYTFQLWALKLNYTWMRENKYDIRWEWGSSNTTIYPHLYGNTTKQMLIDTKTWNRKQNEKWNQTSLVGDIWLIDGTTTNDGSNLNMEKVKLAILQLLWIFISFYFIDF